MMSDEVKGNIFVTSTFNNFLMTRNSHNLLQQISFSKQYQVPGFLSIDVLSTHSFE